MLALSLNIFGFLLAVEAGHKDLPSAFDLHFQQSDYKLKFEFAELVRYNKEYLKECTFKGFKYNRTTTAVNATALYNIDVGYEVEAVYQAYRFASNEYREFPLRFQINLCHAIKYNYAGTASMVKCGNSACPYRKGIYYVMCNWVPDETKLPPFIPGGQYMLEFQLLHRNTEIFLVRYYGTIHRPISYE